LTSLVHIYACCPSVLQSNKITHLFGPEKGRFLDPFPFTRTGKKNKSWSNSELNEQEKYRLRLIIGKLELNGCIKKTLPEDVYLKDDKIKSLIEELNKETTQITLAIAEDEASFHSESSRIYTLSDYQKRNLFNHSPVQLIQSPTAFIEHIPNFIIMPSKKFKLIDPYFFDVRDITSAAKRLEFVYQLIKKYYSTKENENNTIEIEIYGKHLQNFNLSVIKQHFASFKKMFQSNLPFVISFYALKSKNNLNDLHQSVLEFKGKKIHERFFCADKFNFSFEDSSEDRSSLGVIQTWRYEPSEYMAKFIDCYNKNTKLFDIEAEFDSKQLQVISRSLKL